MGRLHRHMQEPGCLLDLPRMHQSELLSWGWRCPGIGEIAVALLTMQLRRNFCRAPLEVAIGTAEKMGFTKI
jgi:hypothetical protein